jgi:hypothetical protein
VETYHRRVSCVSWRVHFLSLSSLSK